MVRTRGKQTGGRCKGPFRALLLGTGVLLSCSHAYMVPPTTLHIYDGRRAGHSPLLTRREERAHEGRCKSVAWARRGRVVYDDDEYEPLPEEEDELGDEVSKIIGYDRSTQKRKSGWKRNGTLQWLKDVYYKIFWFGLDLAEDDDEEYLDEINWFGGWDGAEENLDKASWDAASDKEQPVFRGTYPKSVKPSENTVIRRTGVREETPLWENTAAPVTRGAAGRRPQGPTPSSSGGSSSRPLSRARKAVAVPPRRQNAEEEELEEELSRLEEKKDVLRVSREVWKKRIADMLTSTDELDEGKLTKARSRLQQINEDLASVDIALKELVFLLDIESRQARATPSSSPPPPKAVEARSTTGDDVARSASSKEAESAASS